MKVQYIIFLFAMCKAEEYTIDDSGGMGRMFDGIGGLSGGGATSKLLPNYPEPQKTQILDYLFKPNFGASLQVLKVEIGGDAQSTEGTEASHMHNEWEENYSRGYEWWLMNEAKKRNPNIKLYGLPWVFPAWLGNGKSTLLPPANLSATAHYILKWIQGAKIYHNLTIDYIGVWNEARYNIDYIIMLRKLLDTNNLQTVKIIAPDVGAGHWEPFCTDVNKNATLKQCTYAIGVHYPGTYSSTEAKKTALKLWASEDYSTFNDNVGAGCWARLLNQNYVNGYITSTIAWNLIAAYYNQLPYPRCSIMTALEPWSGNYVVNNQIWITAHTTQFTHIGWNYLKHGSGTGKLSEGGSYVSLLTPDKNKFTMVIETMSHNHSKCIRPSLPPYNVSSQNATFQFKAALSKILLLHVWSSKLGFGGQKSVMFQKLNDIKIVNGSFTLHLEPNMIFTLSTVSTAAKGEFPTPLPSGPFPFPFYDNFDKYPENAEVDYFIPQTGSFEAVASSDKSRGMVNRQTVLEAPIFRCANSNPVTMGGNYNWSDLSVTIDAFVPSVNGTAGVFLAVRVDKGGCDTDKAQGMYMWMYPGNKTYQLSSDMSRTSILKEGYIDIEVDKWFQISFSVAGDKVYFRGSANIVSIDVPKTSSTKGFVAYGNANFGLADFDNFKIEKVSTSIPTQ